MPVGRAHDEQRLGRRPAVLEDDRHELVAVVGRSPARARELALLEVADRVGGVQPVPLEERAQQLAVGGLAGRRSPSAGRSRRWPSGLVAAEEPRSRRVARRSSRRATASASDPSNGARTTPSSVTTPVMSSAGVTSKAGLRTGVSGGAMRTPRTSRTSAAARSSIGTSAPSAVARSIELVGAHT